MSAARAAAGMKPVIVHQGGRGTPRARARSPRIPARSPAPTRCTRRRSAAPACCGWRTCASCSTRRRSWRAARVSGDRLAILTNGGGAGVLATDGLIDEGGRLAELAPATLAALDAVLPPTWTPRQPGRHHRRRARRRYAARSGALLEDRGVEARPGAELPDRRSPPASRRRRRWSPRSGPGRGVPVLASWVGDSAPVIAARRAVEAHRVPVYDTARAGGARRSCTWCATGAARRS